MSSPRFFDAHAHLNLNKSRTWEKDSDWIFNNVSTTFEDFQVALRQSLKHENVYVTAGVHPLEINEHDLESTIQALDKEIGTHRKRIIAVGEIGFDFYRADQKEVENKQRRWFYAQCGLAKKYDLPLVIHVRKAHDTLLDLLEGMVDLYGVIHCFEGTEEYALRYLSLPKKWMLSVSPIVFRPGNEFRTFIRKIDINRLLVETDSPFLTEDHTKVKELIAFVAKEKEIDFEECKRILWENFCGFFKLSFNK
ncbi:putative deoxyribonuclease YcfH [Candidatus Mycoplasma haematohominis]|uniref:Putative deoxyribonuclease YcfH n=1 Tax=Candidatus Mycoplasma haematohominis TaxID=1494318 RepID=A0A478FQE2_9MOLU|nr:putative deoxyribonuclease YcfH [Candidatus Mycoplasma haemohominis]